MNEIEFTILTSILAAIIVAILAFLLKPIKRWFYRITKRSLGSRYYVKRNGEKIYIFPKKQYTRISVSVLAKIEKDGKFLLKSKKPNSIRQDNIFKPLGGVIKLTENMENILKKKDDIQYDTETRYSAKNSDFRIFMNLENNKIIHKALYSETLDFFQGQLRREISEELGNISLEKVDAIFEFNIQQPISIHINYTEPNFSFLRCHDYVHHIIFEFKIKDEKALKKLLSENKRIKFISLNDLHNKTITAKLLDTKNKFKEISYE